MTSYPVGFYACFWGQKQLFKPHKRDPRKGRVDTQRSSGGFGPGQMGVLERESRTNLIKSSFSALTGIPVKTILILDFPFLLIFPEVLDLYAHLFSFDHFFHPSFHMSYLPPSRHFLIVQLFPVRGSDRSQRLEMRPCIHLSYK